MGKVMKKIGGFVSKIAKIASPILSVVKMIPGVGQIAGAIQAGLAIAGNIGSIFKKGFPKGLFDAAKMALENFLPGPLGKITSFVTGKLDSLKQMLPAGVQKFLPQANLPIVRDIGAML